MDITADTADALPGFLDGLAVTLAQKPEPDPGTIFTASIETIDNDRAKNSVSGYAPF